MPYATVMVYVDADKAPDQRVRLAAGLVGVKDAVRLRNEVAAELSGREIAAAQRAARHWLTRH